MVILEQFKLRITPQLKMYLEEMEVNNIWGAAKLVDDFALTHIFSVKHPNVKTTSRGSDASNSGDKKDLKTQTSAYPQCQKGCAII